MQHFPWEGLFNAKERLFWGYLLSSALIALAYWGYRYRSLPTAQHLKEYWWSAQARLDYCYFVLSWWIKVALLAPIIISAKVIALWVNQMLSPWIAPLQWAISYEWIVLAYTVSLFVFGDFTRYWLHRLLHTNRYLWAFHKVHHSAEALNPITFYRVHPVENFLFGVRYSLSVGLITGVFLTLFGARFNLYTIFGVNALLFGFSVLGSHLRHSHIPISYGYILERVFISPRQHQIHHSDRHYHYNYGGYLAIWDTIFGSLKRSDQIDKPLNFGLGRQQSQSYNSVVKLIYQPFKELKRKIKRMNKGEKHA